MARRTGGAGRARRKKRLPRIYAASGIFKLGKRTDLTQKEKIAALEQSLCESFDAYKMCRRAIQDLWDKRDSLEGYYKAKMAALERDLANERAAHERACEKLDDMCEFVSKAGEAHADAERLRTQLDEAVRQLRALRGDHGS